MLLQSRGGWSLKTLPPSVGLELQRQAARLDAKLVQIGGPDDPREEFCDGSLLGDFPLSKWRALFEQATAVFSVDSWTAHFAAILDRPQAVFYGPTDARLIHSKRFFSERTSPSVVIASSVPCSPCDSLTCVTYPGATHCAGYRAEHISELESLVNGTG